jgi:hypothetical protein
MPIRNPGQAWLIQGNTFEQLSNGNVGAVDFQNAVPFSCAGLDIIGNWFGDGNATGTWLSLFGDGIVVSGNYISTGATGISTPGASGLSGCTITGNHFDTVTTAVNTAFAGCSNIFYFGNFFNVVSNVISNAGNITFGLYQDSTGNVIIVGGTKAATSFQVGTPTGGAVANSVNVQGGVYLNNSLLLGAKDTSISTGVGVIHMKSANPATNAAWIPITSADGTVYFVPGWTTNNP